MQTGPNPQPYHENLVSVLLPSYQHEKYIAATINSIISQTYKDIELIIIDDGSTDRTWECINELRKECELRFKNIIFLRQQNSGTCATYNRCANMATGEYLYIIASDDIAFPYSIEVQVNFLSQHKEYCLVVGENMYINDRGSLVFLDKELNETSDYEKALCLSFSDRLQKINAPHIDFNDNMFGTYASLLCGNYIPNGYLIRHAVFDKTGGYRNEAPLEDWYIMLQLSKFGKFKYLNIPLFQYRIHTSNTSKNTNLMLKKTKETLDFEKTTNSCLNKNIPQAKSRKDICSLLKRNCTIIFYAFAFLVTCLFSTKEINLKLLKRLNRTILENNHA